ncbi:MAG: sigma-70 family RNA polymerase sigma factor [Actinomycetia bacterium]|nr:sigma-70 family RNA polymerase sigma factor [Actinomycetes bacterium]MCP4844860.1 sigma-70 family RNA polymerase sigma factor [Actinomycetes bacterium]
MQPDPTTPDSATTEPVFEEGDLEQWFAEFGKLTKTRSDLPVLSAFQRAISGIPVFTAEEQGQLVLTYQAGQAAKAELEERTRVPRGAKNRLNGRVKEGVRALELLVGSILPLCIRIARERADARYGSSAASVRVPDLVQEAVIGVVEAAAKYDVANGTGVFSQYAAAVIRGKVMSGLVAESDLKIPYSWDRMRRIARTARANLEALYGEPPTIEQIRDDCMTHCVNEQVRKLADRTDLTPKEKEVLAIERLRKQGMLGAIDSLEEILELSAGSRRLDATVGDGSATVGDLIADTGEGNPSTALEASEMSRDVQDALAGLSERDQHVLRARFGFEGGEEQTFAEIAVTLGVSAERVRQICAAALEKLRVPGTTSTLLAGHLDSPLDGPHDGPHGEDE